MSFKIADGYVEVHARHDRDSTRRNARQATDDAERVARSREGSMLKWLFKTNPKLMRLLEAPIGSMFGSPIIFAAAAAMAIGLANVVSGAIVTALLSGVAGGFVAIGALAHKKELEKPWNKMAEQVEGVFKRASEPIVQPLIRAINMIGPAFKRMEPTLNRIYKALAPLIEPVTGGILGFIEAMLPGIERAMPGIQVAMLALAKHLPSLGTAIGDFFATIAENGPLLERVVGLTILWISQFFKIAGPILVYFMNQFAMWADAWTGMMTGIKAGMKWLADTWEKIPGWWDSSWGAVKGFFEDLGSTISNFFTNLWDTISGWWNNQTSSVDSWWSSTWGKVTNFFSELPGKIGSALAALPGALYDAFLKAFDAITYFIGFAIGSWLRMILDFPQNAWNILKAGGKLWVDTIKGTIDAIQNYIVSGWNRGIQFWTQTVPRIIGILSDLRTRAIERVISMVNGIMSFINGLPLRIAIAIQDSWNRAVKIFNWASTELPRIAGNIQSKVLSAIAKLGGFLYNAGKDAIRGLINGIESMMGWAVDMAWRAAKNIANGFMDALGIGSPSKVMADEVGKWIPKGIAVGVEANMSDLERIAGMLPDMFTGARPPIGGTGTTSGPEGISIGNVTIQVSLDKIQELDDIESFLNGQLSGSKANTWAGNIFEKTGEYERSYR